MSGWTSASSSATWTGRPQVGDSPKLLTLSEAARAVPCSRQTLYDKLEAGELSRNAEKKIDTADLLRVFGQLEGDGRPESSTETLVQTSADALGRPVSTPLDAPEASDLLSEYARQTAWLRELSDRQQQTIDRQAAELREAEERAAEERHRADERLRGVLAQLDRTAALLPAPEPIPEPPRGFFRRMFS